MTNTIQPEPNTGPLSGRQIAGAAAIVMAAFVLSRLLGLGREVILATLFGSSPEFEAYLVALQLPDTLFYVIAGGALGSAFIPTFSGYLARQDKAGAWRLASAVANLIFLLLALLAGGAALSAGWIVSHLLVPDFPASQQVLAASLMRIMLLTPLIFSLSGMAMAALNSHQRFVGPALAPSFYNVGIIAGAVFLSPSMGVFGLAWGTVAGAALHFAVQLPGLARVGARYLPVLNLRDAGVREVLRLMGPRVLGLAIVQLNFWVNILLASSMAGGSVAALKRGFILMLLPLGVIAQSVATAVFPTFAALTARGETTGLRTTLGQTLRAVLFLALPATVALVILRVPVVKLIFERGEFTPDDTLATAWALLFYTLGLVSHALVEIVTRAFYAMHDTLTPVVVGGAAMALNVVFSLLLVTVIGDPDVLTRGAFGGLALAMTLATTLEGIGLLWILRRRLDGIDGRRLAEGFARSLVASAGLGAALVGLLTLLGEEPAWLTLGISVVVGLPLYAGFAWLLRIEEMRMFTGAIVGRLKR